jgi:peptidyl-prolyl cis-trans isomerase B (cyclophilin B)
MNLKRSSFVFTVIALLSVSIFPQTTPDAKKSNTRPDPPAAKEPFDNAAVAEMAKQCVSLDTASGLIVIEMYPESAPESVRNFLNLSATGLLDTTTFSRVVPDFVIQGGDLYTREGEMTRAIGLRARKIVPDEPSSIRHERGIISMARGDEPNTATTNFFILVDSASYLDGKFAAFGRVTKGMDVVDAINKADVTDEKPAKPVRIKTAKVSECETGGN